jgi:hypothetical protein
MTELYSQQIADETLVFCSLGERRVCESSVSQRENSLLRANEGRKIELIIVVDTFM